MDTVFADKTKLLITHDLSLAKRYSRIIVMENGKIVGDGTDEELLQSCETYRIMNKNAGKTVENEGGAEE